MCGICGLWHLNGQPVDPALLVRMRDSMAHRGPDGAGCALFDPRDPTKLALFGQEQAIEPRSAAMDARFSLGLGHRRLAIIDLASGDQPMSNEDGTVWIVYNGEIYNYRELRGELQARGHVFRTASDTEVIIHAYEEYGVECPMRLNGIFAFALWDGRRRSLFLARDHYGVKPLYWCLQDGTFRFGSEIKAILSDPSVPRQMNLDALYMCLMLRYVPAPDTLFQGIGKLPPGGFLVISSQGTREGSFWGDASEIARDRALPDLLADLQARMEAAVARQMVADVPIALSLSSGVDSGTLLALMSQHSADPVRCFTVGFEGRERQSELEGARRLAARFGAGFEGRIIAEREYGEFMERYVWHLEEPVGNESAPAYYFVARMAHERGIKVLLNGQGPDEAFAGYNRHRGAGYVQALSWAHWPVRLAYPWLARLPLPESARRMALTLTGSSEEERFLLIYSIMAPLDLQALLAPEVWRATDRDAPARFVRAQLARAPRGSMMERMTYMDVRTSLSDNLLLCEDKMAMAASVEARVPFLDLELMDLAERIPGCLKVRGQQGKAIHKAACRRWLPDEVVYGRKIGFDNAMDQWLKGALGRQSRNALERNDSFAATYLQPNRVRDLLKEHKAGLRDHQRLLFMLLSFESWHRLFIQGEESGPGSAREMKWRRT